MADEEQRLRDIQREYLDFLDDEVKFYRYAQITACLKTFHCSPTAVCCSELFR